MSEGIKSAAVIGSGVMGSAIAAQFAGAGIRTHLLDVVPRELPPGSETDARARNRLAEEAVARASPETKKEQARDEIGHGDHAPDEGVDRRIFHVSRCPR